MALRRGSRNLVFRDFTVSTRALSCDHAHMHTHGLGSSLFFNVAKKTTLWSSSQWVSSYESWPTSNYHEANLW